MTRFLPCLALCLLTSTLACGGRTSGTSDAPRFSPGAPVQGDLPAESREQRSLLLVAAQGDTLTVQSLDPATGEARAFGPPLPARASSYANATLSASADRRRVVVSLVPSSAAGEPVPDDRPALVLAGDGASWRVLASAPDASMVGEPSADLSTIWVSSACDPTRDLGPQRHTALDFAGSTLFDDTSCVPGSAGAGLAPDGSLVAYADRNAVHVLRVAAKQVSDAPTSAQAEVLATFPTSTVVAIDRKTVAWIDADGRPLAIPGTATDAAAVVGFASRAAHPYQIVDGTLSVLEDRAVERVQRVPAWVRPDDVRDHFPGHYALVESADHGLALVGPDGSVLDQRAPEARSGRAAAIGALAHSFDGRWPWIVVDATYVTPGTDVGDVDHVEELWLPGDPARGIGAKSRPLRAYTNGPARRYLASPSGEQVLYVEEGRLSKVDLASGSEERIGAPDLVWW